MDITRRSNWSKGSNNQARATRMTVDANGVAPARELRNLDVGLDGVPTLRAGYERVLAGGDVRAAFYVSGFVVVVDGLALVSYNTRTGESSAIGSLTSSAPCSGATLNGQLYLTSATDSLRTDGVTLHPWQVQQPGVSIELVSGSLPAGIYKVAATAVGASGEESGALPSIIRVPDNSGLRVSTTDARPLRLYVSSANGEAMYYQQLLLTSTLVHSVDDASERLTTEGLTELVACDSLAAHHGVLIGRKDNCVFFSAPMQPHLMHPVRGFFQYPADVSMVAVTDGGVYVAADKTWFLTDLESDQPKQRVVADFGAVSGTPVALPDGSVAWFTRYGQAVGDSAGTINLLNRGVYAPDIADVGAAGLVEHNGHQLVVTTMRGVTSPNNLATGDYADLETGNE